MKIAWLLVALVLLTSCAARRRVDPIKIKEYNHSCAGERFTVFDREVCDKRYNNMALVEPKTSSPRVAAH